ncbi:MAG TPA: GntR family transcriptional regulator [Nevskiaceae bacterium]|nr:GntR family transcriptional regulator [Nevskiaceae bacterium]
MSVERACMRHRIRDAIVSRILDGTYPPGERLKELALAKEFNVSQAPVREALRELEALHLVQTEHYRGTRVRAIDVDELRQAYELRLLLEQAAVRRALPCSSEDLRALEAETATMQRTTAPADNDEHMAAVLRFHRKLVEMSRNALFVRAWESMAWDVRVRVAIKRIGLSSVSVRQEYIQRRRKLVKALRDGDGEAAAELLVEITGKLLQRLAGMQKRAA